MGGRLSCWHNSAAGSTRPGAPARSRSRQSDESRIGDDDAPLARRNGKDPPAPLAGGAGGADVAPSAEGGGQKLKRRPSRAWSGALKNWAFMYQGCTTASAAGSQFLEINASSPGVTL